MNEIIKKKILEIAQRDSNPFYVYDSSEIANNCKQFTQIPWEKKLITFASMANATPGFLNIVKDNGLGIFINSKGHMDIAHKCGFKGHQMVFTSSGMSEASMKQVHESGAYINLDSISQVKKWKSLFPKSPLGIRCNIGDLVNPVKTRGGYFLGKSSRLGLTLDEIKSLSGDTDIEGLHLYLGTDILDIDYYRQCYNHIAELSSLFPHLKYLDFGGGFGVETPDGNIFDFAEYGKAVSSIMKAVSESRGEEILLILEPGRIIGGQSAWFVVQVTDVKNRNCDQFVGVNASTAQFTRPLMYPDDAYHPVTVLSETPDKKTKNTHIFGCSTYSRDFFATDITLPEAHEGMILAFGHAGSYCASSYTTFLGFEKASEYFI
ncbi:MAG: hypothetical protein JXR95_00110 [Deltaproteobacteria bacterium]|nr:hypothetical protein [Deltaproteobacteria bacterium]